MILTTTFWLLLFLSDPRVPDDEGHLQACFVLPILTKRSSSSNRWFCEDAPQKCAQWNLTGARWGSCCCSRHDETARGRRRGCSERINPAAATGCSPSFMPFVSILAPRCNQARVQRPLHLPYFSILFILLIYSLLLLFFLPLFLLIFRLLLVITIFCSFFLLFPFLLVFRLCIHLRPPPSWQSFSFILLLLVCLHLLLNPPFFLSSRHWQRITQRCQLWIALSNVNKQHRIEYVPRTVRHPLLSKARGQLPCSFTFDLCLRGSNASASCGIVNLFSGLVTPHLGMSTCVSAVLI